MGGAEHMAGVAACFEELPLADVISELLQDGSEGASESSWEQELEKRVALLAFLNSTRTFPPDVVLPNLEDLQPDSAAFVKKKYPKYREAFNGRMSTALGDLPKSAQLIEEPPRARGLAELQEFCAPE